MHVCVARISAFEFVSAYTGSGKRQPTEEQLQDRGLNVKPKQLGLVIDHQLHREVTSQNFGRHPGGIHSLTEPEFWNPCNLQNQQTIVLNFQNSSYTSAQDYRWRVALQSHIEKEIGSRYPKTKTIPLLQKMAFSEDKIY